MYDTEAPVSDALRCKQERTVHAWMRAATLASGIEADDDLFTALEFGPRDEGGLGLAVESKKRDNLALGEALLSIGLIGRLELAQVERDQAESDDLVGSLLVASAIRSRLGEILLKAKRITSCQLEFALELQRTQGGLLGETLVSLGWLDQSTLDAALAEQASRKAA